MELARASLSPITPARNKYLTRIRPAVTWPRMIHELLWGWGPPRVCEELKCFGRAELFRLLPSRKSIDIWSLPKRSSLMSFREEVDTDQAGRVFSVENY